MNLTNCAWDSILVQPIPCSGLNFHICGTEHPENPCTPPFPSRMEREERVGTEETNR